MYPYHIEKSAVTPEEAVRIAYKASGELVIKLLPRLANDIWDAVEHLNKNKCWGPGDTGRTWLAAIWMAGRVQGIREERARRKGLKEV